MQECVDYPWHGETVYKIQDKKIHVLDKDSIWEELKYKLLDQYDFMLESADTAQEARSASKARMRVVKKIKYQRFN